MITTSKEGNGPTKDGRDSASIMDPCHTSPYPMTTARKEEKRVMTTIRVRAQEPRDIEALAEILESPLVLVETAQVPYRSIDWWRERLASGAEVHRLVAEREGQVVGSVVLHTEVSPRRRHVGALAIMVREGVQGQGVGTALMAALVDLADNWLGVRRVELQVYADNARAVRLYEKFGFAIEGTARAFALRDGVYADAYLMARVRL